MKEAIRPQRVLHLALVGLIVTIAHICPNAVRADSSCEPCEAGYIGAGQSCLFKGKKFAVVFVLEYGNAHFTLLLTFGVI